MVVSPAEIHVEEIIVNLVLWLRLVIEVLGALMIGVGVVLGGVRFMRGRFPPGVEDFTAVSLTLGYAFRLYGETCREPKGTVH